MIKDLCSEGAYQEGTYVIFNLILIQFAEIVFLSSLWFVWLLFPIVSTLATRVGSSFLLLISITTDFLRYAPCMRKVKNEYEKCAESYKNIMKKIHEQKTAETFTSTTTTSTTTIPPRIVQISLMKRQQSSQSIYVSHETTTTARNASNEAMDQGEVQIKTVCWWVVWWLRLNLWISQSVPCSAFQEYMKCSESAVQEACGSETAEFTRNFLDKMLSSLIRVSSLVIFVRFIN